MVGLFAVENAAPCSREELDGLLKQVAAGDVDAFAALYEATKSSVYGFALSILKNPHDAEDVMQSCYVNIHHAATGYRSHGKPMAWILTVVKHLCYQRLREQKRTAALPEDLSYTSLLSDGADADERLLLQFCLQQLSDEERQILMLHALSGFKHREIAALLDLPIGTVLSKYHRAIKRIQMHFKEESP